MLLPDRQRADGGAEAGTVETLPDGGTVGGGGTDGGTLPPPPPPPCALSKPFGIPVAITELNSAKEDYASEISPDELTIVIGTNNGVSGLQLFSSTRASKTSPWGPLQPVFPAGNWDNWSVTISGNTAVLSSDRNGHDSELLFATRPSPADPFGPLALLTSGNTTADEETPHFGYDGRFYFDSSRNGTRDLFVGDFSGGAVTGVTALDTLNTPATEAAAILAPDQLTLYFYSDRAPAKPGGDIFVATRASTSAPFGNVMQAPNLNSDAFDAPGPISADGCRMYLTSSRFGTADVFVATRPQ